MNYCMVADLPPYSKFSFTEKSQILQLGEYDDDVDRFSYHIADNPAKQGYVRADLHVYYRG